MKKIIEVNYYKATGMGAFPDDMLRYDDGAFIKTDRKLHFEQGPSVDEMNKPRSYPDGVAVAYVSYKSKTGRNRGVPTIGRWRSFLWGLLLIAEPAIQIEDDWVTVTHTRDGYRQVTFAEWLKL